MARIKPDITLSSISGPGLIFNSRCPDNMSNWRSPDRALADALTGNQITILGDTPVLCNKGVGTKEVLSFLGEAGFEINPTLYQYQDEFDRLRLIRHLTKEGNRMIVQHLHNNADLPAEYCWVHPETLAYLNNKANLSELVSPAYVSRHKILPSSMIRSILSQNWKLPVVIKA